MLEIIKPKLNGLPVVPLPFKEYSNIEMVTHSRLFLFPIVVEKREKSKPNLNDLKKMGLVNTYLFLSEQEAEQADYDKVDKVPIYAVFSPKTLNEESLLTCKRDVGDFEPDAEEFMIDEENFFVIAKYYFDKKKHEVVWNLFWKGRYSKFPEKYKELISGVKADIDFSGMSFQRLVMNKHELLLKYIRLWYKFLNNGDDYGFNEMDFQEYFSIPEVKRETFRPEKVRESLKIVNSKL